jgi:hypothetical protein
MYDFDEYDDTGIQEQETVHDAPKHHFQKKASPANAKL